MQKHIHICYILPAVSKLCMAGMAASSKAACCPGTAMLTHPLQKLQTEAGHPMACTLAWQCADDCRQSQLRLLLELLMLRHGEGQV